MSRRNDELKKLREIVRKRRSAVTAKENRIKRNTGVDVRGTSLDPRRPLQVVDKYNRVQLSNYLNELNAFMARGVGFLSGANGSIIPKRDFLSYKKLERQVNKIGAMKFAEIADIFVPVNGMTIRQRENTVKGEKVRGAGEIVVTPYSHIERDAADIKDLNALNKLKENLKSKTEKAYLPTQIKLAREQLDMMLDVLGNGDLKSSVDSLTDYQFDIMWNHTNFATNVSSIYFVMQSKTVKSEDRWHSSVIEDYSNDIRELLSWASQLPKDRASAVELAKGRVKIVNNPRKANARKKK